MEVNKYIDHTLLKADATSEQITQLCDEAIKYNFASVCINSFYVGFAAKLLKESDVKVCTVVGFPLGSSPKEVKAYDASLAIDHGATEIDMVINIGALKDKLYPTVQQDIETVAKTCHGKGAILKVIIETCLLTEDEKIKASELVKAAGADFIKTSTGFSTGGATVEDIKLMREHVGPEMGVKASGGVRSLADAKAMIEAGATRLGASSGVKIMEGLSSDSDY